MVYQQFINNFKSILNWWNFHFEALILLALVNHLKGVLFLENTVYEILVMILSFTFKMNILFGGDVSIFRLTFKNIYEWLYFVLKNKQTYKVYSVERFLSNT